jgi:hypothetical protein
MKRVSLCLVGASPSYGLWPAKVKGWNLPSLSTTLAPRHSVELMKLADDIAHSS